MNCHLNISPNSWLKSVEGTIDIKEEMIDFVGVLPESGVLSWAAGVYLEYH